ncbi:MAG: S8 family serine peptidase [Chloroflexi bacterium]|nr:S8 family serine peptidase [Chloroflexota bacterium]
MFRRPLKPAIFTLVFASFLAAVVLKPAAQTLPVPAAAAAAVDMWVVTLAPGTDPYAVAGRMGLVVAGMLSGTPDTYAFRGAGPLKVVSAESKQAFDAGLARSPEVVRVVQQVLLDRVPRVITDPLFPNQWHLNNTGQGGGTAGEDANVTAAWALGPTGTGVVVSSVDDGLWHTNPDLAGNYMRTTSWDFVENNQDPSGGGHGTNVGGVMAANDDGTACGVGAAYNAQLSGVRLLNAGTDANEAMALSHTFSQFVENGSDDFTVDFSGIDIYNNSWGPSDNGFVLEAPGPLTEAALAAGAANGRGGLGAIYVWAAGNGKGSSDDVNADGYANSRYTIAVSATTNQGESSWYSEQGSSILVNAPSNGGTLGITTTSGSSSCTSSFGGTSSASPLAAGVIALMLEANPTLTWRDVQHILVLSADKNDPTDTGWVNNGAGHPFNHFYGFGRINAAAAVTLADTWTTVGPEVTADSGTINVSTAVPDGPGGGFITSTFDVTESIQIESIDVVFNASHAIRGQLYIDLVSPSGAISILMHGRPDTGDNYTNWRLNTVAHWDEISSGTWTLRVRDTTAGTTGAFNSWQLKIYGTDSATTSINNEPDSVSVLYDEPTTLTVGANGGAPISYQWYTGLSGDTSSPITGAESAEYTIPSVTTNSQVWVRVTGANNSDDSQTVSVTMVESADMLLDEQFNMVMPSVWVFPTSEGKIVCDKQYISATCAARLNNTILNENGRALQDVDLDNYPWSLRTGDTLRLTGQVKAAGGIVGKIRVKVTYASLPTSEKVQAALITDGAWQAYDLPLVLTRTDIERIRVIVLEDSTAASATRWTSGLKVWIDDLQLSQERTSARGEGAVLPPPPVPGGFRGGN